MLQTFLSKLGLKTIAKLLVRAIVTKTILFWLLRQYVNRTDTQLDDRALDLVIALDEGKVEEVQDKFKELIKELEKKLDK